MNRRRIFLLVASVVVAAFGLYALIGRKSTAPRAARATEISPAAGASSTASPTVAGRPADASDADASPGAADRRATASRELLAQIVARRIAGSNPKDARALLVELERLKEMGAAALPALREFLATGSDADYQSAFGKIGFRDGKVPTDFTMPPSLRLALLEVTKNIGGPAAEEILARELKTTGRGVEAAYLAAALEEIAPGRYSASAAAAARDLLAMPLTAATKSLLDRSDREYLYNILATAGDRSQIATAQQQLLLPGGQLDRGALRYLQQMLGADAVDVAVRAWSDPGVPAGQKEPLVRVALNYVGTSDRADQFYQTAIYDPNLSPEARKNLVEDLNQDGFANLKQLSPADVGLIDRRLGLIDRLAPATKDPVLVAAFAEAKKDLLAMREKALRPPKK